MNRPPPEERSSAPAETHGAEGAMVGGQGPEGALVGGQAQGGPRPPGGGPIFA